MRYAYMCANGVGGQHYIIPLERSMVWLEIVGTLEYECWRYDCSTLGKSVAIHQA